MKAIWKCLCVRVCVCVYVHALTVCRIDVNTESVLEGIISDEDIPHWLIDRSNRSSLAVDCTWVLHGPPLYRVSRHTFIVRL